MNTVKNLLVSLAEDLKLKNIEISIQSDLNNGDGFLGVYYSAKIKSKEENLDVFIKTNRKIHKELEDVIKVAYLNEFLFYDIIYPEFVKHEKQKEQDVFKSVPKCYKILRNKGKETIILENLKSRGFKQHNRNVPMNDEHIKVVLEELAHFHAISFVIKNENEKMFNEIIKNICCVSNTLNLDNFSETLEYISKCAFNCLDPNEDVEVYLIFKEFILTVSNFIKSLDDLAEDNVVITHGDLHNNNLMFKYENKFFTKPKEVRFLDWQLMRVSNPVIDVATFFYSSCNEEQLKKLEYFLKVYHNKLTDYIFKLGSNPQSIYPFAKFFKDWKIFARFGLVLGCLIIKILLSDADDIHQQKSDDNLKSMLEIMSYELKNSDEWKNRVKLLIYHFVKCKFLEPISLKQL